MLLLKSVWVGVVPETQSFGLGTVATGNLLSEVRIFVELADAKDPRRVAAVRCLEDRRKAVRDLPPPGDDVVLDLLDVAIQLDLLTAEGAALHQYPVADVGRERNRPE